MRSNEEQTRYILEKYDSHKKKKNKITKLGISILSVAACAMVVFGTSKYLQNNSIKNDIDIFSVAHSDKNVQTNDNSSANEKNTGVYLPKIEIPESNNDMAMDMVAMVIKDDQIYTCWNMEYPHSLEYNDETKALLGEYIGTGNGKINCSSKESDYEGQFASNTTYDFYSVNGYNTDFRLAAICNFADGTYIQLFDCLNGITLYKGSDLFRDRLHLAENYTSVQYQYHDDWNYAQNVYHDLYDCSEEDIRLFLQTLYDSDFFELPNTENGESIYDRKQAHLYFKMKDGTTVRLRLFEGGLVSFAGSPASVYVKIPDEVFDKIFQSTTK